jgi:hypothetical protein
MQCSYDLSSEEIISDISEESEPGSCKQSPSRLGPELKSTAHTVTAAALPALRKFNSSSEHQILLAAQSQVMYADGAVFVQIRSQAQHEAVGVSSAAVTVAELDTLQQADTTRFPDLTSAGLGPLRETQKESGHCSALCMVCEFAARGLCDEAMKPAYTCSSHGLHCSSHQTTSRTGSCSYSGGRQKLNRSCAGEESFVMTDNYGGNGSTIRKALEPVQDGSLAADVDAPTQKHAKCHLLSSSYASAPDMKSVRFEEDRALSILSEHGVTSQMMWIQLFSLRQKGPC